MIVKLPRRHHVGPGDGEDYEVDPWDYWQAGCALPIGSLHQVREAPKSRKKVKRRPIGFLADIDQLIDADD